MNRKKSLEILQDTQLKNNFDVFIAGGGINGAIAAASLSYAGYNVLLAESHDFASATSQASSNLIWGGIKYLENFEFALVYKLCRSRNRLISAYPEAIQEIRFYLPHHKGSKFPLSLLKIGVWLYWLLGLAKLRPPKFLSKRGIANKGYPISLKTIDGGVEYSDAYLVDNDSRFVFSLIKKAHHRGATTINYLEMQKITKTADHWQILLKDKSPIKEEGSQSKDSHLAKKDSRKKQTRRNNYTIKAKFFINATGPYVDTLNRSNSFRSRYKHLFSKGIHIVVNRIIEDKKVLTFFSSDDRPFFVIPMGDRSCIGTTDTFITSPNTKATDQDIKFLLDNINSMLSLAKPICKTDIVSVRCGVRPLVVEKETAISSKKNNGRVEKKDWISFSRKHVVEQNHPDMLCLFGGKLTDCINLAEEVLQRCNRHFNKIFPQKRMKPAKKIFKSGHFFAGKGEAQQDKNRFYRFCMSEKIAKTIADLPLSADCLENLWRRQNKQAFSILNSIAENPKLGKIILPHSKATHAELLHMVKNEMIVTPNDILRRRTMETLLVENKKMLDKLTLKIRKMIDAER